LMRVHKGGGLILGSCDKSSSPKIVLSRNIPRKFYNDNGGSTYIGGLSEET
jgi:hypothetical protein